MKKSNSLKLGLGVVAAAALGACAAPVVPGSSVSLVNPYGVEVGTAAQNIIGGTTVQPNAHTSANPYAKWDHNNLLASHPDQIWLGYYDTHTRRLVGSAEPVSLQGHGYGYGTAVTTGNTVAVASPYATQYVTTPHAAAPVAGNAYAVGSAVGTVVGSAVGSAVGAASGLVHGVASQLAH